MAINKGILHGLHNQIKYISTLANNCIFISRMIRLGGVETGKSEA